MKEEIFPVVILAGGLATRLRPITEEIPKALIDIQGKPFIAYQLRLLSESGIRKVILCVGYRGEIIQDVIGNGTKYNLHIEFSFDGPQLLGTAGSIKKVLYLLGDHFFVLYGDSFLPCNYRKIQNAFEQIDKLAMMSVFRNEGRWDQSNVEFRDGQILAYDKKHPNPHMQHIDYGLGVFKKASFQIVPDYQPYDLDVLYQNLLNQNELAAYEVKERFYEIGSFSGLEEFRNFIANNLTHYGKP